jgi:hypothetical protein
MDRGILSRIISSAILVLMFAMVSEAQGPTAKSSPSGHASIALPVNPPLGWRPDLWAGERTDCQRLADEYASGKPLAQSEFPLAEGCRRLSSMHMSSDADSSTTPAASAQPTPIPSPGGPAPAAASSPGAVGPFGTPVAGPSAVACGQFSQPPDVAADVSSTEMAEFTNFGLQAWDKVIETPKISTPLTPFNFWVCRGCHCPIAPLLRRL